LETLAAWAGPSFPRIDSTAFPGTPTDQPYWTGTEDGVIEVVSILFVDGGTPLQDHARTNEFYVRCVH
jgi:hypothetical protein